MPSVRNEKARRPAARFRGLPDAPVWRVPTDAARAAFHAPAPRNGRALAEVYEAVKRDVLPWSMGNQNPRFWGWYMGAGHPGGVLGDFLGGVDGSNCGGGDTSAAWMERQVLRIAISNHRTRAKDIDHVLGEVVRRGRVASPAAGGLRR